MSQADEAIAFARAQIGKPYVFGAVGPNSYDCSGLIVAAYKAAKPPLILPHWTGALIGVGSEVTRGELSPGDLVFPDSGHVQLYVGSGRIVEAQQRGVPVREGPMWGFWRARRVAGDGSHTAGDGLTDFNPLKPLEVAVVGAKIAKTVADPRFWARIGMGVAGVWLILAGFVFMNRRPLIAAGGSIVQGVGTVANTAIQGAAFGFGAGKAGGLGGAAAPSSGAGTAIQGQLERVPKAPAAITPRSTPPSAQITAPAVSPRSSDPTVEWYTREPGLPTPKSPARVIGRAKRPPTKLNIDKNPRRTGMFK